MILNQHSAFTLGVGHGVMAMATMGLWPDAAAVSITAPIIGGGADRDTRAGYIKWRRRNDYDVERTQVIPGSTRDEVIGVIPLPPNRIVVNPVDNHAVQAIGNVIVFPSAALEIAAPKKNQSAARKKRAMALIMAALADED